jgi:hypothetical protein
MSRRFVLAQFVGVAALVLSGGCGPEGPKLHSFSGKATRGGKPVSNVTVVFLPADLNKFHDAKGTTDAEGAFTMTYGSLEGVPPGQNSVYIVNPEDLSGFGSDRDADFKAMVEKYGSAQTSPLKIDVTKDETDYQLKLD